MGQREFYPPPFEQYLIRKSGYPSIGGDVQQVIPVIEKKAITTIVDADDKNCLAQSTVVLKFNQGSRQWLYIIAGLFFFASFFCRSKRKKRGFDKVFVIHCDVCRIAFI